MRSHRRPPEGPVAESLPPTAATDPRPLPLLRAMIDSLDREMLQLLSRRMALVGEIAAWKREHALRIRDPARERDILDDRRRRAAEMGLPPQEVESIFRVLMRASRDHQAALRAELPGDVETRSVAVVGGGAGMGQLVARLFGDLGHQVVVADLDTPVTPVDAAAVADVTIIAVPVAVTEQVVREVGPAVRADGLLMDVTSVKAGPVAAMLASTRASVVGTHPMFGPGVHSVQGQRVVLCRARGDAWADWVARMLSARGLSVVESTAAAHDRAMSLVQVLTHFQTQVLGLTLARAGVPLGDTLRFTSPAYLLELYVTARHFAQSPDLYAEIEMRNPGTAEVTAHFMDAAREVAGLLAAGDREGFRALFDEVQRFFGPFTGEAMEQSSYLIDHVVERL
jgi:chorismate mutase / prephenate dehydrogenase